MKEKENWERLDNYVKFPLKTINEIFKDNLKNSIKELTLLKGGLRNTNYKVVLNDSSTIYLLRIYLQDGMCENEANKLNFVKKTIPVPEVIHVDISKHLIPYEYMIQTWIKGQTMKDFLMETSINSSQKISIISQTGKILANIHNFKYDKAVINQDSYQDIVKSNLGIARKRLGEENTKFVWEYIKKNYQLLQEIKNKVTLIHADFNTLNILVKQKNEDWIISAVLDWEFSFEESHLFDIGNFLRYEQDLSNQFTKVFIESYIENGGIIPPNWKKIIRYFDLIALIQMLNMEKCGLTSQNDIKKLIKQTTKYQ